MRDGPPWAAPHTFLIHFTPLKPCMVPSTSSSQICTDQLALKFLCAQNPTMTNPCVTAADRADITRGLDRAGRILLHLLQFSKLCALAYSLIRPIRRMLMVPGLWGTHTHICIYIYVYNFVCTLRLRLHVHALECRPGPKCGSILLFMYRDIADRS